MAMILILAGILFLAQPVQSQGTDEVQEYAIDIVPQEDGSTLNTYTINWCVISDSAGPLTWITLGMPNEQYEIFAFSGDIQSVITANQGFDSMIRLDLTHEVNAGECIDLVVSVHQFGLAGLDENTSEIGFYFTPGWFNEVPVDHLRVTWQLPTNHTLIKSFNPNPTSQDDSRAIWEDALQPGEKFPISVIYDKSAFPNFNPDQIGETTSSIPTEAIYPDQNTNIFEDAGNPVFEVPGLAGPLSFGTCVCLCLIAILVLILLFIIFRSAGGRRSYRRGGWFGGYPSSGSWGGGSNSGGSIFSSGSGENHDTPDRSGGGSGAFGGRGSSCACVSSGCACACAGGGRAGCSRKGFDVSRLINDKQEENRS